jgi:hypothetical protein
MSSETHTQDVQGLQTCISSFVHFWGEILAWIRIQILNLDPDQLIQLNPDQKHGQKQYP